MNREDTESSLRACVRERTRVEVRKNRVTEEQRGVSSRMQTFIIIHVYMYTAVLLAGEIQSPSSLEGVSTGFVLFQMSSRPCLLNEKLETTLYQALTGAVYWQNAE